MGSSCSKGSFNIKRVKSLNFVFYMRDFPNLPTWRVRNPRWPERLGSQKEVCQKDMHICEGPKIVGHKGETARVFGVGLGVQ